MLGVLLRKSVYTTPTAVQSFPGACWDQGQLCVFYCVLGPEVLCCVGGGKMAEMHMCFSRTYTISNCVVNTDTPIYTPLWIYLLNALVARDL